MRYWYCELPPQLVCNTSPPSPLPHCSMSSSSSSSHNSSRNAVTVAVAVNIAVVVAVAVAVALSRSLSLCWQDRVALVGPRALSLSLSLHVSMYNQTYIHTCIHTYSFTYVCVCCSHSLCDVDYSLCMHACVCPPPLPTSLPPATTYRSISDLLLSPFRLHSD